MKKVLIIFFLFINSVVLAKTYYVAPDGNDNRTAAQAQNINTPWKTWGKAFNSTDVNAGDTVYFRGGIYKKDISEGSDVWYYPNRSNGGTGYNITRNGTAGNYVHYFAYPPDFDAGNPPILDCLDAYTPTNRLHSGIRTGNSVNYVHFKGLITQNVNQPPGFGDGSGFGDAEANGWQIRGNSIVFENCIFRNIWGHGIEIGGARAPAYNWLINCDAHDCCDSLSTLDPGNDGTGFCHISGGRVYYDHCRAWLCGDQGFTNGILDAGGASQYTVYDECWSFNNGMIGGIGHGFSMGWIGYTDGNIKRTYKNCVAAFNRDEGWFTLDYKYPYAVYANIYNCTGYHNGYGGLAYGGYMIEIDNTLDTDGHELLRSLKNNISYANEHGNIDLKPNALYTHVTNSWDTPPGITLSAADFMSLDSTGITAARQADGSLPDNDCYNKFLHLSSNSNAIDKGTDVGLDYTGAFPDLGAFEYHSQQGSNMYPSVVITSPANGNTFIEPATIIVTANATDADGSISKVEFFNGATKLGEKTSNPWSFTWNNVPVGNYSLTAAATDNSGAKTTSSAVSVTVNNSAPVTNQPPAINISNPATGETFTAPATIAITANASDADGTISKVEFFNGATKLGEKTSNPWSFTWNNVPDGTYSLTAVATDNSGAKTTSSAVSITVNNLPPVTNQPPVVTISNPTKGEKYTEPANITIDAIASDTDGTIRKVELFNGSIKLVEMTTAPWSFTWKDVAAGTYLITAVATDNLNATTTSSHIDVEVEARTIYDVNSEIFNLYPNPNDGHFSINLTEPLQNENSEIVITTFDGQLIYREPLLQEEITKEFDLSYFKSGIYIFILAGNEIIVTKKFIKE